MNPVNPYELLYMFRTGDAYAEKELYRVYRNMIISIVDKLIGKNKPLYLYREDLIQDGMIEIVKAVEYYREDREASFSTYLYTIVQNSLFAKVKTYCRYPEIQFHNMRSLDDPQINKKLICEATLMDPVYYLDMREAQDRLYSAIHDMNRKDKAVLYSVIRDEPCQYAAEQLHLSYAAYSSRKTRIKKNLQEKLFKNI